MTIFGRKGKRKKKRLPKILSAAELELLLNTPSAISVLGVRTRCVFALMGRCGLRVSEACNLKTTDVHLEADDPYIRVIGKGDQERRAYLGRSVVNLLEHWREIRPTGTTALFPVIQKKTGILGTSHPGRAITRYAVYQSVRHYAKKAGIKERVHPHMLRHTAATQALKRGEDIRNIQVMLGHVDISSTQIYTHVTNDEQAAMARRLDPAGKEEE